MNLLRAMLPLYAVLSVAHAQTTNPLKITRTSPEQFRLDWIATNQSRFQMEGSLDLISWVKIGPVITGTGVSQTMLVAKTTPKYFYKLSKGGLRLGFDGVAMSRGDDHTYPEPIGGPTAVSLGFTINFFGELYSDCYVNNNGNISLNASHGIYIPTSLEYLQSKIIAPFWADVDTYNVATDVTRFSSGGETIDGHPAFGVTYRNVGYFSQRGDKLNSFQVVIISRPDTGSNNFDIEFNYDKILWEAGSASSGSSARAGFSDGDQYSMEIEGSGNSSYFLDTNLLHGLIYKSYNSNCPGRLIFRFRNGLVENSFSVNAGTDRLLRLSELESFQLNGLVLPLNFPGISYEWSEVFGVNALDTISNPEVLNPIVSLSGLGTRKFKLTARSTGLAQFSINDIVEIRTPSFNVSAGDDVYFIEPDSLTVILQGTADFSEGGIVNVQWIQIEGDMATITNPTTLNPQVTLPGPGSYSFRLTATTSSSPSFVKSSEVHIDYY